VAMRPDLPSINISRRGKIVIGVLVSLFVLLSAFGSLIQIYTDWLWFGEVDYRTVFTSIFLTRVVLFVIFGAATAAVIGLNVWLAYRMRPPFRPISQEQENLERYRVAIEPHKKLIFLAIIALSFFASGMAAQQNWRTWQLWRFGAKFNVQDPQFHRDISFFAWDYPTYRLLLGFGFNMVIFSLVLSLAVHYIFGALRIATPGPKLTISARRHVTVLVFLFIVLKAMAYWLDRYGLVFSTRGKTGNAFFSGASYTDVHASLPAKTILFWVAILIAIAVLASLWLKSAQIATISFVVLLVLSIGISGIYPAVMQQFSVKPNADQKEAEYISRNITATRQAYGIVSAKDGGPVTYEPYGDKPAANAATLSSDRETVPNIRLTDPNVVSPTVTNGQQIRNYYGFPEKLDIDRYTIDGVTSDYIVSVRELKASNLQGNQTSWIQKHTAYTHGYGFIAGKASEDVNDRTRFTVGDIPVAGKIKIDKPQIYFGELGVDYSIVGAAGNRENDGSDGRSRYDGKGGVPLNFIDRVAFAVKYRQGNFLLNDVVSSDGARVIYNREPRERVKKIAPWLQVDSDPFPSVVDGRIVWMLDGYTTMANYPYSERRSFGDVTADVLSRSNRTAAQPNNQINYIRNSVKATVDAFDGTVNLYAWDEQDPVLKTWRKVFPGVIKDKSEIPPGVLDHVRYPTDIFEAQRTLLERYHVDNSKVFFDGNDQWTVQDDPTLIGTSIDQPPYYVLAGSNAGTGDSVYQLTTPMKVNVRPNMAAYVTVVAQAGPDYGKLTVLSLPTTQSSQGPQQIHQRFNSNTFISQDLNLLRQGGSDVIEGNLLTLPIGNTFLYVEPIYVRGKGDNPFPLLSRVVVEYGGTLGYGVNLPMALRNLTQGPVGREVSSGNTDSTPSPTSTPPVSSPPASPTSKPPTTSSSPPSSSDLDTILRQLDAAFTRLQNAYRSGDFQAIGEAQADVQRLSEAYLNARAGTSTSPSKSPSSATPRPSGSPS